MIDYRALDLKPGDVLVANCSGTIAPIENKRIKEDIEADLAAAGITGVSVLVLPAETTVQVLRAN